jgi:predicted DNA-binding protein with PD1-like motif
MQDHAASSGLPPPRAWVHPGPIRQERIIRRSAAQGRHVRIDIPPGVDLYDGLVRPLTALGIRNAAINLWGGEFERLVFCVAPPDPTGRVAAAYTDPIDVSGGYLLAASATLGSTEAGHPLVHCHAGLRQASGLLAGGHLLPHLCVIGNGGLTASAVSLDGFEVRVGHDPETTLSLFLPMASDDGAPSSTESKP